MMGWPTISDRLFGLYFSVHKLKSCAEASSDSASTSIIGFIYNLK